MTKAKMKALIRKGAKFTNRHTREQCTVAGSSKSRRKGARIVIERRIPVPPYKTQRAIPYHAFIQNYEPAP